MNLNEIEARANAATPGMWYPTPDSTHAGERRYWACSPSTPNREQYSQDSEFMRYAREDVLALVARVRELEAESAKWKDAFERIRSTNTDLMLQLFDAQERTRAINISPVLVENAQLKSMVLHLEAELLKRKP